MIKNYSFLLVFLLGFSGFVFAQVSGTVLEDTGSPLPGVSIVVKGTTTGTTTDFDGNYSIDASNGDVLVFSYVGFETQEITVEGSTVDVQMQSGVSLDQVVLVGSRNANRTATDTPVPVDVLDVTELTQSAPQVSVTEILNYAAPSFSSNPQTISDGTDHIAPAALRGLGPDQVLVLINGKRRHKTALVNVNGTFGRGSVGTDMTAIPSNAISKIQILRDGAAAQYGSDAIAGVINIVLKKTTNKLDVTMTTGANFTSESSPQKSVDGERINLGLNYGLPIGEDGGFINFTGNFDFRGWTNRMQQFNGQIFNGYNAVERVANNDGYDTSRFLQLVNNPNSTEFNQILNDMRGYAQNAGFNVANNATVTELQDILDTNITDAELAARGQTRSDYNMRVGQSELRGGQFFANMEIPLGDDLTIYGNGGLNFKNGNAAGFYRLPFQSRAYTPAYINGFLPEINSDITDQSVVLGIRGVTENGWNIDFSTSYGKNEFLYSVTNSNNASYLNSTPFEADSGGFNYSESTTNFDMTRFYDDIFAGLNIAFGAEYRVENYSIIAGEEVSYSQYNLQGNVHDPTDSSSVLPTDFFGSSRPGGIQVFPGFRPENEVNAFRNSVAGYLDVEADFTESFLVSGAVRYENFSDFGGTINFKLASRLKASENLNFRAGLQTGFRAPSLHQINYSSTSTLFIEGVPNEVGVFANTDRVARILKIDPLKEETSFGVTTGFTAKIPSANLKITLDGYMVNIDDRVVLTGQFSSGGDEELAKLFSQANADRAAFFANSVDTQTLGIDIVADHKANISDDISLTNTFAFTISDTEVKSVNIPSSITGTFNEFLSYTYFDDTSRLYLEAAVPRVKGNLSHSLNVGKFNFFLRNSFFGEVTEATNVAALAFVRDQNGNLVTDPKLLAEGAQNPYRTTDISPRELELGRRLSGAPYYTPDPNRDSPTYRIGEGFTGPAIQESDIVRRYDLDYSPKIITDLSVGYNVSETFRITVGANNLFDIYPDESDQRFQSSGRFIYSRRSTQFGTNGRHLFARLNFTIK